MCISKKIVPAERAEEATLGSFLKSNEWHVEYQKAKLEEIADDNLGKYTKEDFEETKQALGLTLGKKRILKAEWQKRHASKNELIKRNYPDGKSGLKNLYYNRVLLYHGATVLSQNLIMKCTTVGFVAALLAGSALSMITLGAGATSDPYLLRTFVMLVAISLLANLICIIMVTTYINHLAMLMATDEDIIWFVNHQGLLIDLPDVLLAVGIICKVAALCVGTFDWYGQENGRIISSFMGSSILVVLIWYTWALASSNLHARRDKDDPKNGLFDDWTQRKTQ